MKNHFAWVGALAAASLAVVSCTSILGGFQASGTGPDASTGDDATSPDGNSSGDGHGGAVNGTACTTGTTCASGSCADGVCCNNACSGTCESCSVTGHVGTCTGYAVNMDPEHECLSVSEREALEAGAEDGGVTGDVGVAEGGDATVEGGAAEDAGDASHPHDAQADALADGGSDAQVYDLPDGATSSDKSCAGSCNGMGGNGQGACVYPSSTTSCGTAWCNTPSEAAKFACNSQGGCAITSTDCGNYACESNACVSGCSATTDCSDTAYCNTTASPPTCTSKIGNGLQCASDTECQSGVCTNIGDTSQALICCASACTVASGVTGGTCYSPGHVGQCECSIDCGDAGGCVLWYKDLDGDTYGDKTGTVANGRAMVGCSGATPPATWVTNNTDCDDTASTGPNAFPGQTAYFGYPDPNNVSSAYDYNCDGTLEKSVPEQPGQSCEFCYGTEPACAVQYTCNTSGDQAGYGCQVDEPTFCFGTCNAYCGPILVSSGSLFFRTDLTTAFTATIACGAYANTTECGTCSAAGAYPATTLTDTQQTCH